MRGKIKRLIGDRGFGFITPDEGKKDIFFHCSAVENADFEALKVDDPVMFETEKGDKGPRAVNVRLVG